MSGDKARGGTGAVAFRRPRPPVTLTHDAPNRQVRKAARVAVQE